MCIVKNVAHACEFVSLLWVCGNGSNTEQGKFSSKLRMLTAVLP